jgi:hypothetical protein
MLWQNRIPSFRLLLLRLASRSINSQSRSLMGRLFNGKRSRLLAKSEAMRVSFRSNSFSTNRMILLTRLTDFPLILMEKFRFHKRYPAYKTLQKQTNGYFNSRWQSQNQVLSNKASTVRPLKINSFKRSIRTLLF